MVIFVCFSYKTAEIPIVTMLLDHQHNFLNIGETTNLSHSKIGFQMNIMLQPQPHQKCVLFKLAFFEDPNFVVEKGTT